MHSFIAEACVSEEKACSAAVSEMCGDFAPVL